MSGTLTVAVRRSRWWRRLFRKETPSVDLTDLFQQGVQMGLSRPLSDAEKAAVRGYAPWPRCARCAADLPAETLLYCDSCCTQVKKFVPVGEDFKVRGDSKPERSTSPTGAPGCPACGHQKHQAECMNMASDSDCICLAREPDRLRDQR